jgi:hypothetical protein
VNGTINDFFVDCLYRLSQSIAHLKLCKSQEARGHHGFFVVSYHQGNGARLGDRPEPDHGDPNCHDPVVGVARSLSFMINS